MKTISVVLVITLLLTSCTPMTQILNPDDYNRIVMHVLAYRDLDINYYNYKTFDFVIGSNKNYLLEKELLYQLQDSLQHRGFRLDKNDPDMLVYIQFNTERGDGYTPPLPVESLNYTPGNTNLIPLNILKRSTWTPTGGTLMPPFKFRDNDVYPHECVKNAFSMKMFVNFIDTKTLLEQGNSEPIWRSEVKCTGSSLDFRNISPFMYREALNEFPLSTGLEPYREISLWDKPLRPKPKSEPNEVIIKAYGVLALALFGVAIVSDDAR